MPDVQFALPRPGAILSDRYRLERPLGEGASSVVFAAHDLRLERDVAVKILKPQALLASSSQRERFLNEARTLAQLAHPHIVPIFDVGESADGTAFFVMELVGDRTLASELDAHGPLSAADAIALLLPVMGALACAHDRGVVHRDLKPSNLVLEARQQGPLRAKLLDFGIAKASGEQVSSGVALGTPAYMAPEQATLAELGPFTDVWAMGVLLYRCLTGKLPFEAPVPTGVLLKLVQGRAPLLREVAPQLPARVALVIDQALEPKLSARHVDMRAFARALAIACRQDGLSVAREPDPIGLPAFAAWLDAADVERTGRMNAVGAPKDAAATGEATNSEPDGGAATREIKAAPAAVLQRSLRGGRALAMALMVLVTAYLLWPEIRRSSAPQRVHADAAAMPALPGAEARAAQNEGPATRFAAETSTATVSSDPMLVNTQESPAAREATTELPVRPPKPAAKKRTSKPNTQPATPAIPAQEPEASPPRVMTEWDW